MIKKIGKDLTFKLKEDNIDVELEEKIEKNWNKFIIGKEGFFNGDIFVVDNVFSKESNFTVIKAKYARIIYAKSNKDVKAFSLFSSILFKTKDNYYLFILNNHDRVNIIGGLASLEDFDDLIFNPCKCLERETKEELGLDINNKENVLSYSMDYLTVPDNSINVGPFGIVFTGVLNYTKDELITYFTNNRNSFDDEIKELLFFTNEDYKNLDNYSSKEPYLMELLDEVNKY